MTQESRPSGNADSPRSTATPALSTTAEMGRFQAYLSFWVSAAIGVGLAVGSAFPSWLAWLRALEVGGVNLAIAALVWLMIFPTMIQVDFSELGNAAHWRRGLVLTVTINWLLKPLSMAVLATVFLTGVFSNWVPADDAKGYVAGLILLGAAPCTGLVFVWSRLTAGDPRFTIVQVSINDLILLVAFAPWVAFLLGVTDISIPWTTLLLATAIFVVLPLVAGAATRRYLLARGGERAVRRLVARFDPLTSAGLLLLVAILFGLQAPQILRQPFVVLLIAVPLLIQTYGIFAIAYGAAWWWRLPSAIAAPAALIGTSNFFELAIAVALALFGPESPAALATVVGVLVEVPVMLSLVWIARRTRPALDLRATRPVGAQSGSKSESRV